MPTIQEIRAKYPQYEDMPDAALADALHKKFYADIPKEDFYKRINFNITPEPQMGVDEDVLRSGASGVARGLPNLANTVAAGLNVAKDRIMGDKTSSFQDYARHDPTDVVLGEQYQPKTTAGEYAKAAGSAVGTLPLGGSSAVIKGVLPSVGRAAASGVAGLAGAKGGGEVGEYLGGETGRLIGEIGGGIAGSLAGAYAPEILSSKAAEKVVSGISKAVGADDFAKGVQQGLPKLQTAEDFRALANTAYRKADELGGTLKPDVTNRFIDEAARKLVPQTAEGKLLAGESVSTKLAERLQNLAGKPISLRGAQEIDEILGDEIDRLSELGRLTKEGKKIYDLQTSFRKAIENAAEHEVTGGKEGFTMLKTARSLWKTQAQLRDVEKIIARAEMTDNPATSIKTGFRTLASNPERLKGFSPEAKKAIEHAAKTGLVTDALRMLGSRLNPIAAGAAAGFGSGPVGGIATMLATEAGSAGARNLATQAQMGRAGKVVEAITGQEAPSVMRRVGAKIGNVLKAPNPMDKIKK